MNFQLKVGRTRGKVQHPIVGMEIEVLISTKPYSCTDLARFYRKQVCGT
jgi:hypothetical protein